MNESPEREAVKSHDHRRRPKLWQYVVGAVASILLLVGAAIPAGAAELMRVTFIRHGESYGNTSGLIDTSTPGPVLTPKGEQQARDIAAELGDNNYDAIYASTMVRTQLTAAPMSQYLGLPIQVLPGLQEIEAGRFEGTPEASASRGYGLYPIGWALPGLIPQIPESMFNKGTFMPGTNVNGYVFDARVDAALQTMYDKGDRNPVVYSHGGTIMFWTMMNVQNLTPQQKLQLLQTAQLGNTDYVVIEGNNEDGWTLVSWNGQQFAPEPTLGAEVKLQSRTLTRQLTASVKQVTDAFASRDITKIVSAINHGLADAAFSITKFQRAVNAKLVHEADQALSTPVVPASPSTSSLRSTTQEAAANPAGDTDGAAAGTGSDAVKQPIARALSSLVSGRATVARNANDATPEKPGTRLVRPGHRLLDAIRHAGDNVATSITKLTEPRKQDDVSGPASGTENETGGADDGNQQDAA